MRTAQDLLAERRANVIEQSRERDPMARALLQFHIDELDREIEQVTDGAARRNDVREVTHTTRRAAQRRSRAEGSAKPSSQRIGVVGAEANVEPDSGERSPQAVSASGRAFWGSSNPALQQGQDLPPSTSHSAPEAK